MASLGETLGSPWPLLAIGPCLHGDGIDGGREIQVNVEFIRCPLFRSCGRLR
jgi:hypothetical protein